MKKLIITMLILTGALFFVSCDDISSGSTSEQEQARTEANQQRLLKAQPPVTLDSSLERENINKRTLLWNNSNKVSYIYLISHGNVMAFYSIKGKVSSVNSQITNPNQIIRRGSASTYAYSHVLPSPAEDGSYGTNGDGIFFFTTSGVYVEWSGQYLLCDAPLKLTTKPTLIRAIK